MENIIKQLKKAAKETKLSTVEKAAMKTQLLHYVKTHPVRSDAWGIPTTSNGTGPVNASAFSARAVLSPFSINNFRNKKTLSAFVIGGLLLGSTVSFAAENTVPGDILYPIKIHVNESVLSAIAVTPQAKADWSVTQTERRLQEVEKLASTPSATPEVRAAAEANFNASADQVQQHISNFEKNNDSSDAMATAGRLTDMLRKHEGDFSKKGFAKEETEHNSVSVTPTSAVPVATPEVSATPVSTVQQTQSDEGHRTGVTDGGSVLKSIHTVRGKAEQVQADLRNKYQGESTSTVSNVDSGVAHTNQGISPEVVPGHSLDRHDRGQEEIRTTTGAAQNRVKND